LSEYQRYRFICVDNGLDKNQRFELRTISSRAEITSNTFSVHYHYSGQQAEPIELMAKYFDLGTYYSLVGRTKFIYKATAVYTATSFFCSK